MAIALWLIISALIALIGRNREIGYGWGLVLCLVFSPAIGVVIILFSKKKGVEFIDANKNNRI